MIPEVFSLGVFTRYKFLELISHLLFASTCIGHGTIVSQSFPRLSYGNDDASFAIRLTHSLWYMILRGFGDALLSSLYNLGAKTSASASSFLEVEDFVPINLRTLILKPLPINLCTLGNISDFRIKYGRSWPCDIGSKEEHFFFPYYLEVWTHYGFGSGTSDSELEEEQTHDAEMEA